MNDYKGKRKTMIDSDDIFELQDIERNLYESMESLKGITRIAAPNLYQKWKVLYI